MLMDDPSASRGRLNELRELGISIAIDDFGTGYASLSYLSRFPVQSLKIDRSFVAGLGQEKDAIAIVAAVTSLGHALGLEVTAEGVETAEQLERVKAIGCDHAQGFYFSRALTAEEFTALLSTGMIDQRSQRGDVA